MIFAKLGERWRDGAHRIRDDLRDGIGQRLAAFKPEECSYPASLAQDMRRARRESPYIDAAGRSTAGSRPIISA